MRALRFCAVTTDAKLLPRSAGLAHSASEANAATIFVVEPLTSIRELIANFLARLDGFRVVGASGDRHEAERECERLKPDIAVIDWALLPDSSNINLAEAVRRCSPETKVIVFSAAAELHFVSDAIAAGVSGFVVKTATLETLSRALRAVAEGKQFFCPEMAGVLRDLLRRSSHGSGRACLLTHREKEILREIAKGHFSKEIAAKFDLSVFTVENIRRRIMRKTGLKSVAELTLHAVRLKLIAPPTSNVADPDAGRHEVFQ
jgi:DNA-binding NarL/FixJ family response regulator